MDGLAILNEFVLKVVHCRQTTRLQALSNWIPEDVSSHPYFVPPAPYLVCKPQDFPNGSGILVQAALIDAHFRKAWMPYFRREGHPVVSPQAFLDFVGDHLPQEAFLDLPNLTGEELPDAAMAKKSTAGGLDGWAWNEEKTPVLRHIENAGKWLQSLLDAYIAMIPRAEGDSTPLGQRFLCVLTVVVNRPLLVWPKFKIGSIHGSPIRSSVQVKECLQLMPGILPPLISKKYSATPLEETSISSLLMWSNLLIRQTGIFLTVPWEDLDCQHGFVKSTFRFTGRFGFGFN